jgi:hypothetical protein
LFFGENVRKSWPRLKETAKNDTKERKNQRIVKFIGFSAFKQATQHHLIRTDGHKNAKNSPSNQINSNFTEKSCRTHAFASRDPIQHCAGIDWHCFWEHRVAFHFRKFWSNFGGLPHTKWVGFCFWSFWCFVRLWVSNKEIVGF